MKKISILDQFAQDAINAPAMITGGKSCKKKSKSSKSKKSKSKKSKSSKSKSSKSKSSKSKSRNNCCCSSKW